jgi:hypothetical protein
VSSSFKIGALCRGLRFRGCSHICPRCSSLEIGVGSLGFVLNRESSMREGEMGCAGLFQPSFRLNVAERVLHESGSLVRCPSGRVCARFLCGIPPVLEWRSGLALARGGWSLRVQLGSARAQRRDPSVPWARKFVQDEKLGLCVTVAVVIVITGGEHCRTSWHCRGKSGGV